MCPCSHLGSREIMDAVNTCWTEKVEMFQRANGLTSTGANLKSAPTPPCSVVQPVVNGTYEEDGERVVDGASHALDDHALGKAIIFVADVVSLVKVRVEGLPLDEVINSDISQDVRGLTAFTECQKGVGVSPFRLTLPLSPPCDVIL